MTTSHTICASPATVLIEPRGVGHAVVACFHVLEHAQEFRDRLISTELGWRPIETAPKNQGRLIDVWTGDRRLTGCWWDEICHEWRTLGNSNKLVWCKKATHWMEIPAPPNGRLSDEDKAI